MSDSSPSAVNSPRTRQQQYLDALRQALDDASRAFFAANSDLSRDGQLELISSWSEHERRSPYRPAMLAAGEMNGVGGGVGGKKKKVRGYIGRWGVGACVCACAWGLESVIRCEI